MLSPIVEPLLKWYDRHARVLPWRENQDPYRIWISEIMLQQTRVEAVIPYYERFLAELPDVAALAAVSEERLMKLWEGLGYYSRARNLKRAAEMIMHEFGGRFPDTPETLAELPGIGPYTVGAIASIAFGLPEPAVDGNVLRVYARLCACSDPVTDPRVRARVAAELRTIYPAGRCGDFTQSLMELGATVCVPNGAPLCLLCPLAEFCRGQGHAAELPVKTAPKPRKIVRRTILLWCTGDKIGLQRRPDRGILAGMWEFPGEDGEWSVENLRQKFATIPIDEIRPCTACRHVFTHVEWEMTGFLLIAREIPSGMRAVTCDELTETISLPSAFRPFVAAWKEYLQK